MSPKRHLSTLMHCQCWGHWCDAGTDGLATIALLHSAANSLGILHADLELGHG